MVATYAGMSLTEVEDLELVRYLTYRRDAFLDRMNQTEAGREYLDAAWRLEQTAPDRSKLRKMIGGGEASGK